MGSFSNYLENAVLNHVFKNASFSQPTNIYVALSTADPGEDGSGLVEPAFASGYYRVTGNVWAVAATGATANTSAIVFPTAGGGWGTVTHFGLFDASGIGAGNMLAYGPLAVAKTVTAGDILQFPSGSIFASLS